MTPNSDCKLYIRLTNHFSKYIKYKNFIGLDYQLIIVNYDKQPTLTNKCNLTKKCYCMGKKKCSSIIGRQGLNFSAYMLVFFMQS